ncbi:5-methylcytosine rRNA methyltransferase nsun4 [Mactra antiquata]
MFVRVYQLGSDFVLNSKINTLSTTRMCVRSFKMKKKQSRQSLVTNTQRALEHFDLHYKPVYKDLWPSMRIALLTAKKTCAIMNNFAQDDKFNKHFYELGAIDIIHNAVNKQLQDIKSKTPTNIEQIERKFVNQNIDNQFDELTDDSDDELLDTTEREKANVLTEEERMNIDRTNLYSFVPTKTVYSENESLRLEESRKSVYTPMDVKVDIIKPRKINIPTDLSVMSFPKGDVQNFPSPKLDIPHGVLCHFMLDAASILPVIALDLDKGDNVLDLCAAPGGKTLTILQTGLPGSLTCNDISGSRINRLLNILHSYIPQEDREHVNIHSKAGSYFTDPIFDKVLVDVPCSTDRHSLLVDDNNLFNPNRINERIELPKLQKELLIAGIKSCRPGGCVVYSTCSLSAAQNDGVIQDTIDDLWRTTSIDIVVEDLSEMTQLFNDFYRFYNECRFGQLVLPSLSSNYGPMYFSRLRRVG